LEAEESLRHLTSESVDWAGLLSRDATRRRRALKELSFRLPFRPLARFIYLYLLRLGFLDGVPGFLYCNLMAFYEFMIVMKLREIKRRNKGLPI